MTTRTKRRKKTRKIFSFLLSIALVSPLIAGEKQASAPYATVAVTVFREPGFALPGAEVSLTADAGSKPKKGLCDARGDYVFRVSAEPKSYLVRATAKGFHPEEKSVAIHGESERAEVTLELHAESK